MMNTTIPSSTHAATLKLQKERRARTRLQIKAQNFRDEGRSSNLVDSNMKLLKERIDVLRTTERLERNCRPHGWDYASTNYIRKPKKEPEYLQTMALICGTTSFPILIGTTLLCILSVTMHINL